MTDTNTRIAEIVQSHPVVLFMKGTADFPMCGFSARVATILQQLDVEFQDVNVLDDDDIRQGVKEYTNWPTIPQLYVNGQFVGGCDIVVEMYQAGELPEILNQ